MHVFVYGTLRRSALLPMHRLLQPSTFVGVGRFQGKLYNVGDYPAAVPSDDPADTVLGELYLLHEPATTLAALDCYEGCTPDDSTPHEYVRIAANIRQTSDDFPTISAQIYLYGRPVDLLARITQGDYLEWLVQQSRARVGD